MLTDVPLSRGYRGRVVSATETTVRMELEAAYKTVTVKVHGPLLLHDHAWGKLLWLA